MNSTSFLIEQALTKEDPVIYCENCLSLAIRIMDENSDYCDKCGCTKTKSANIEEWEELYEIKYGEKFLNEK